MKNSQSLGISGRFASELIGTYILITILIAGYFMTLLSAGNTLLYALIYAATLTTLIAIFREWSYQFNPIVSLVALITKGQNIIHTIVAILAQLLGAVLASRTIVGMTELVPGIGAQVPSLETAGVSPAMITTIEGFGIFLLLLVYVLKAREKDNYLFPVLAGLSILPGSAIAVFISGAAFNPIRIMGPAFFTENGWQSHWVYWVGPVIAALVAVIVSGVLLRSSKTR